PPADDEVRASVLVHVPRVHRARAVAARLALKGTEPAASEPEHHVDEGGAPLVTRHHVEESIAIEVRQRNAARAHPVHRGIHRGRESPVAAAEQRGDRAPVELIGVGYYEVEMAVAV